MIFRFSIPIDDYCGQEVFYKQVYFEGERCPSLKEVMDRLLVEKTKEDELCVEHPEYGPFCDEYGQCIETLALTNDSDFPFLCGNLLQTNCFVTHPKWGRVSITGSVIRPFQTY